MAFISMRILVLGTNYTPEKTAIAPFTTGLCEHLAEKGHDVTVVTAFPYFPEWRVQEGYRGHLYKTELVKKVRVRRVWHFVPSRASNLLQRLAHDLSFTFNAFWAALFTWDFDVLYCSFPPPTLALTAYVLAKLHGKPYVIKLADLASDAALATGILKEGFAVRLARAIEGFAYRNADVVVCLCQPFIERLVSRGIDRQKLQLIPDWGDTQGVFPILNATTFRSANGFSSGQFLVMHTGNMGKKQDLMNLVRAAELSKDRAELMWLLVGQGEERSAIEEALNHRRLKNIRLLPLQPAEALAEMYSAADVLVLNQRAAVVDAVIPSKLLTYMAAGRTVLAAVSDKSETARYIERAECGLIVHPEDPAALVDAVLALRKAPALRERFGTNARAYVVQHFTKEKVLREYDLFFSRYAGPGGQGSEAARTTVIAD
jgi:colanic acid biosynthesis glycosyl transferase WcaI